MRYVWCPYEIVLPRDDPDRPGQKIGRPKRQLAAQRLLFQDEGDPPPFIEAEGLGGYAVVLIFDDADAALVAAEPGVLAFPDLPILGGRLGDVGASARSEVRDAMLAQGWTATQVRDRLGTNLANWTLRAALEFMVSERRKARHDRGTDTIVLDGAPQWVKPLPLPPVAGGAFPTTGVLDNFNRPDGTGLSANGWTAMWTSAVIWTIGNAAKNDGTISYPEMYWNPASFGPDQEAYATISTISGAVENMNVDVRLTDVTVNVPDGYLAEFARTAGTDTWSTFRYDNGAVTAIGSVTNAEGASGEKIGLEAIGSTITRYRYTAGAWASQNATTDGTYGTAGTSRIAMGMEGSTYALDDFGGGTVWAGPAPPTPGAVASVFTGTTVTAVLPTHATNDILVCQGWRNDAGDLTCGTAGWALIGSASNDANLSTAWFWKRAASGAETNPVVTSSTAATVTAGLYARAWEVSGCVTSGDPFEDATFSGPTTSTTPASSAIDTTAANEIALALSALDASTAWTTAPAPAGWYTVGDDAAGSAPTVTAGTIAAVASGTTVTATLPAHATNDILVVAASFNVASTLSCGTAGWAAITGAAPQSNANLSTAWFWKRAASGAETNPVVTSSATASATQGLYATPFKISGCITSVEPFEDVTLSGPTGAADMNGSTITTLGPQRLALAIALSDDNETITNYPPATWSTLVNTGSDTGGDGKCLAIQKVVAVAGNENGVRIGTQGVSRQYKSLTMAAIPLGAGRSTAILKNVPTAGAVGSATVGTLSGAAYWRTLTLGLGTPVVAVSYPVFPTMAPVGAA